MPSLSRSGVVPRLLAGLVIARNAVDGSEVAWFKITNIQHGTLYLADGTTPVSAGTFITDAQASAGLKFTPEPNFNGTGSFDVQASTSNADAGLGGGIAKASINVAPVNDAPTATGLSNTLGLAEDTIARLFTTPPTIADVDSAVVTATLTLADPAAGRLINATPGAAGVYTVTGSPAAVATALTETHPAAGLALAVLSFAHAWFIRWITEIAVTDRRIIYKRGFINRHTVEMNMDKVASVDVDQSILGRMLGYGSIHVVGPGAAASNSPDRPRGIEHLHRVAQPLELRNAITCK